MGNLVFGKGRARDGEGKDRYGRTIGRVHLGGVDTGFPWMRRKYAKDLTLYALEDDARAARQGLWASDVPVPPWQWRNSQAWMVNIKARFKMSSSSGAFVCAASA